VKRIIHRLEHRFGRPKNILRGGDPLDVLIGTILSQNTTDKNSDHAYQSLRLSFPRWDDLRAASPEDIESVIKIGGLQRIKGRRILSVLHTLNASYG
jgi:endonuclease-3